MKMPQLENRGHYELIKYIRDAMLASGKTTRCPLWSNYRYFSGIANIKSCRICRKLFPRLNVEAYVCPCYTTYKRKHLANVLNMVLRANKHLRINVEMEG